MNVKVYSLLVVKLTYDLYTCTIGTLGQMVHMYMYSLNSLNTCIVCLPLQSVQLYTTYVHFTATIPETLSFIKWPSKKKHLL
jgi:hypothetical protein